MDRNTAKDIIDRLNVFLGDLNMLLVDTKPLLSEEEFKVMKRAVARMMNTSDSDIAAMITNQYPDLDPCKLG